MNRIVLGVFAAVAMLASQPAFSAARVAVLHLAPFAGSIDETAVDIAINGTVTFENVKFKDFVPYTELAAGDYTIDIIPAGATDPVISRMFTLVDGTDYSVFAIGNGGTQPLELAALEDNNEAPTAGNLKVRVVHTAPFAADLAATEVSIRTAGGDIVNGLVGVQYKQDSGFFEVPEGTYDLKVASNDGTVNYIDPLPADLPAGAILTLYATGDGINQDLGILAYPLGELPVRAPVDNSSNGWWGIQEGSGVGFILQPIISQNRMVGSWYTYDEMGNPLFLTFDSCGESAEGDPEFTCSNPGAFDGVTAETTLYLSTGGGSEDGLNVVTESIGTIEFEIMDCLDALATVTLDGQMPELFTARRLIAPLGCSVEEAVAE